MKILSYHPFSLYANGGGNRILRRLYEGHEADVISLVVEASAEKLIAGKMLEIIVYAKPVINPWARWKLRNVLTWLRTTTFKKYTISKIQKQAAKINYDTLHVINHGVFSAALCEGAFVNTKPLWVSFHDHYKEVKSPEEDTKILWVTADRRLVISEELGQHYQQIFGNKPYEIITDGVNPGEITIPIKTIYKQITIYFAGLLHITYMPLFNAFANAIDVLSRQGGYSFKLILRGTQNLKFLNNRSFETEYRQVTFNDKELKDELDEATILYLPIKFTSPYFYLYSLSTKMVGYLGAPGTILYHGPGDSAAFKLLKKKNAAVCCTSLNIDELTKTISIALNQDKEIALNAKILANDQFNMQTIQQRFWLS